MSDQNKDLVRRYLEQTVNAGNVAAIDELTSADYVGHMSGVPQFDRATHKQLLATFRAAFPDMRMTIEDLIAEGDKVVNRTVYIGTHRGSFNGSPRPASDLRFPASMSAASSMARWRKIGPCSTCWGCCSSSAQYRRPARRLAGSLETISIAEVEASSRTYAVARTMMPRALSPRWRASKASFTSSSR